MIEKFLVIGNYGNYNIGDETILKGLIKEIVEKKGDNIKIYIPTRNVGFEKIYHSELNNKIISFYVYNFRDLLKYSINASQIIIGGGGIWSGYTGFLAKFIPLYSLIMSLLGKETSFRGVGVYKTASFIERQFVNLAILFSKESTVRDIESYNTLWRCASKKITIQKDFAIKYLKWIDNKRNRYASFFEDSMIYKKLNRESRNKFLIGVSVKPIKNQKLNYKLVKEFVKAIEVLDLKYRDRIFWIFFPFSKTPSVIENDVYFINEILKNLSNINNKLLLDHTNPITWYFLIKDTLDTFIGMRYHSLVFAWVAKKPFFGISYENKNINFLNQIKHPYWSTVRNLNAQRLVDFIELQIR